MAGEVQARANQWIDLHQHVVSGPAVAMPSNSTQIGGTGYTHGYPWAQQQVIYNQTHAGIIGQDAHIENISEFSRPLTDYNRKVKVNIDVERRKEHDVAVYELSFVLRPFNGIPDRECPMYRLGLSAFNEYLRSPEGIIKYGYDENSNRIWQDWAFDGVNVTSPVKGLGQTAEGPTAETTAHSGPQMMYDVSLWCNYPEWEGMQIATTMASCLSLCFIKILFKDTDIIPSLPMISDGKKRNRAEMENGIGSRKAMKRELPKSYWKALMFRHSGRYIEPAMYQSFDKKNYFKGHSIPIGTVINKPDAPNPWGSQKMAADIYVNSTERARSLEALSGLQMLTVSIRCG